MAKTAIAKTKSQLSAEAGIKILKSAIKSGLSLSEASRKNGKGRNYVSDIKARIKNNYQNKNVNRETYKQFKSLVKEYEAL